MSNPRLCTTLLLVAALPLAAHTQNGRPRAQHFGEVHSISAGIYGLGGITHASQPLTGVNGLQGQVGAFAEYSRHVLQPGLDARLAGEAYSFPAFPDGGSTAGGTASQKLVGPRLAYSIANFQPYVEALFGVGHQNDTPQPNYYSSGYGATLSSVGTARFGAFGCDFVAERHLAFRAEYLIGSISDHGYPVQNFSFGVILRLP